MKKATLPLLLLTSCMLLGCTVSFSLTPEISNDHVFAVIPPYEPPTPPSQPKNIDSIEILGIPEDYRIAMGLFDEANIRCQINYTDASSTQFQLLQENLPYELREMLGVPGEHNVTVQIANKTATFKVIMVDEGIRYVVRFLNYNDDVLYMTKVMPNNKVRYGGEDPRRLSDIAYKYRFEGWDVDIDEYLVDHSTDIHATYEEVFKNNDYLALDGPAQLIAEYQGVDSVTHFNRNYSCFYAGRLSNVQIARDDSYDYRHHTQGKKEEFNYDFDIADTPVDSIDHISSPTYKYHPEITLTLPGVLNKSYNYVDPGEEIPSKYIPASPYIINYSGDFDSLPFTLEPIRTRNSEGKTYTTVVNDYRTVINDALNATIIGDLLVPEDFPTGDYTATLFGDFDVYTYVYAEDRGYEVVNSGIYAVFCLAELYVGINSYDNRIVTNQYTTSTYDSDMMGVAMFAEMMKKARDAFED